MAKAKIIKSYSLECLENGLLSEIGFADSQITSYESELNCEERHRQNDKSIDRISKSMHDWILKRDVLHQCLCKIRMLIEEIEI